MVEAVVGRFRGLGVGVDRYRVLWFFYVVLFYFNEWMDGEGIFLWLCDSFGRYIGLWILGFFQVISEETH